MQWEELKEKVKTEYITTSVSYRKLAEKYDLSRVTLGVTGKKEGWVELRRQYQEQVLAKSMEKAAEQQADRNARLQDIAASLLDAVEKRLGQESIATGQASAAEYRQLASTLRDLKEIQMIKSRMDIREQEARIRMLEQQLHEGDSNESFRVEIEGAENTWAN